MKTAVEAAGRRTEAAREGERAKREAGAPSAVREAKEGESAAAAATKGTVSGDALFEAASSA